MRTLASIDLISITIHIKYDSHNIQSKRPITIMKNLNYFMNCLLPSLVLEL